MELRDVKSYGHCRESVGSSSENYPRITCDPAVSLWDMCAKVLKPGTRTDVCAHVFMAPWFTITKRRKQPRVHQWMVDTHSAVLA